MKTFITILLRTNVASSIMNPFIFLSEGKKRKIPLLKSEEKTTSAKATQQQ
jgi:hypothetical protein